MILVNQWCLCTYKNIAFRIRAIHALSIIIGELYLILNEFRKGHKITVNFTTLGIIPKFVHRQKSVLDFK